MSHMALFVFFGYQTLLNLIRYRFVDFILDLRGRDHLGRAPGNKISGWFSCMLGVGSPCFAGETEESRALSRDHPVWIVI